MILFISLIMWGVNYIQQINKTIIRIIHELINRYLGLKRTTASLIKLKYL